MPEQQFSSIDPRRKVSDPAGPRLTALSASANFPGTTKLVLPQHFGSDLRVCPKQYFRGISSVGRASGWQPEGQGFESPILHSVANPCKTRVFLCAGKTACDLLQSQMVGCGTGFCPLLGAAVFGHLRIPRRSSLLGVSVRVRETAHPNASGLCSMVIQSLASGLFSPEVMRD